MTTTKIMNNGLSPQFARVEVLSTRTATANGRNGAFTFEESEVRFPDGAIEWLPSEELSDAPENGFQEWTGDGVWCV